MADLESFQRESNRIEGIGGVLSGEVEALERFVTLRSWELTVSALQEYVAVIQPDAALRTAVGSNVRVGSHVAPPGGPDIVPALEAILQNARNERVCRRPDSWRVHVDYETLHPFTDGNGRSGRALWLWVRGGSAPLGFLHTFYYQTLERSRRPGFTD